MTATAERRHVSAEPIERVYSVPKQVPGPKPRGLWYDVDREWEKWCRSEDWGWPDRPFGYRLEIERTRILVISSVSALRHFTTMNGTNDECRGWTINWANVASRYAGIEIAPYQWGCRHVLSWYYGWDVASGCIWDASVVQSIERVRVRRLRKPS